MAWTTFAYDAVAGSPSYTAGQETDWMHQMNFRPNGVLPGLDLALAVTADGAGGVLVQNGACVLAGRTALLSGGPESLSLGTLPASGFRAVYAIVVRFNTTTQSTDIFSIAGATIANPGPAVNPSIAASDILLAYVLDVNTAGTHAYAVTDARTFTSAQLLQPTGSVTYDRGILPNDGVILAALTGSATLDISAGALRAGAKLFVKNVSIAPQTLTLTYAAATSFTLTQGQSVVLVWDGAAWQFQASTAVTAVATGPYAVTPMDYILAVTSGGGALVVNLPAATQIGKAYKVLKVDSGAGSVAVTPNGTDKIGSTGNVVFSLGAQYAAVSLICSSAGNWTIESSAAGTGAAGRGRQMFLTSGTWTCPPGVTQAFLSGAGQGGLGGPATGSNGGSGGGSGAFCNYLPLAVVPGTTYTATISTSAASTFAGGALTTVSLGKGGNGALNAAGGAGGTASGGATAGNAGGSTAGVASGFCAGGGGGGSAGLGSTVNSVGAGGAGVPGLVPVIGGAGATFGNAGGTGTAGGGGGGGGGVNGGAPVIIIEW